MAPVFGMQCKSTGNPIFTSMIDQEILDKWVERYNSKEFISDDPISIPHSFRGKQDREIMGLWVAILSWGNRKSIIQSGKRLSQLMDHAPYDFVLNHQPSDLKRFLDFKHRTFNATDALYFIHFFRWWYARNSSLEQAFSQWLTKNDEHVGPALEGFHTLFFSLPEAPGRTRKHIATPARNSSCKRLNMFLRWMVRRDNNGVDFGIWNKIKPNQLLCPLDIHTGRVARQLGLLERKQNDWRAVLELTFNLRKFDQDDPVKYDFALFGSGVNSKFI